MPLGAEKYCFPHSLSNFKYIECNISGYFTEIFSELKAFGIGHMVSNNISTMGCQTVPVVSCNSGGTQAAWRKEQTTVVKLSLAEIPPVPCEV